MFVAACGEPTQSGQVAPALDDGGNSGLPPEEDLADLVGDDSQEIEETDLPDSLAPDPDAPWTWGPTGIDTMLAADLNGGSLHVAFGRRGDAALESLSAERHLTSALPAEITPRVGQIPGRFDLAAGPGESVWMCTASGSSVRTYASDDVSAAAMRRVSTQHVGSAQGCALDADTDGRVALAYLAATGDTSRIVLRDLTRVAPETVLEFRVGAADAPLPGTVDVVMTDGRAMLLWVSRGGVWLAHANRARRRVYPQAEGTRARLFGGHGRASGLLVAVPDGPETFEVSTWALAGLEAIGPAVTARGTSTFDAALAQNPTLAAVTDGVLRLHRAEGMRTLGATNRIQSLRILWDDAGFWHLAYHDEATGTVPWWRLPSAPWAYDE